MTAITLNNVSKQWGDKTTLDQINAEINDGEFIAILGPSGCGKSTLLFMLAGIYTPSAGDICFDGQRINEVEAKDRNIGIVFQSYALYPHMNVRKNILFPLRFAKTPKAEAVERAEVAAKLVHIDEFLDQRPSQLSGGQQQRVALARALVKEPKLLLLDEPLSNLDATLRLNMRMEIRALQQRLGVTTILVTHDQIEAITMADRIICMSRGKIEQIGTAEQLYQRPQTLFVAEFIGSPPINILAGSIRDDQLYIGDTALQLVGKTSNQQATGNVKWGLRPEAIHLATSPTDTTLAGKITMIESLGREYLMQVDTALGQLRVLCLSMHIEHRVGQTIPLSFSADDVLLFDSDGRRIPGLHAQLMPTSTPDKPTDTETTA